MKKPAAKSYALRIEPQLVKPLQELKKHNRRSLNAEINAALETWIGQSHVAGAQREESAPISPAPGAVDAPKAKRKSTRKQADIRAAIPDASPGE